VCKHLAQTSDAQKTCAGMEKIMKRIKDKLNHLKIKHKLTLTVFFFAFIPIIILFIIIIHNMREGAINDQVSIVKYTMQQNYAQVQKNIDLCNMSTKVFLNNTTLIKYLERVKSKEDIDISVEREFYLNEIASMERLVNSNPYLYQIRVYVDSDTMVEMMPILYRTNRMERLQWGKEDIKSGTWEFNYTDEIFPREVMSSKRHLMSLVTNIQDYDDDNLGVIEVAIRMNDLFPGLYSTKETDWSCFIDGDNKKYYDESSKNRWNPYIEDIFNSTNLESESDCYHVTKIAGEDVIVAYKPISELHGRLIKVVSLKNVIHKVNRFRSLYTMFLLIIMGALFFVINLIVKTMSKRFYVVYQALHEVQKGKLDVEVSVSGSDEIGELANRINIMLVKIKQLMENSVKREILVKNSEIRALQNQINTHFIYNVLESIKMMAEIKEDYDISDAITSLGKMLRYSMKGLSKNVTVKEEIDYIKNYIAIMNLRFDYEIYLSLNIPEVLWEQEIPKMSLQPIVENSICHGIENIAEDTNIYIKGITEQDYFTIEVSDQGKGIAEDQLEQLRRNIQGEMETSGGSGHGLGLKNVQDRIQINFGEDYGITISSKLGCYTKVCVKIPRSDKYGK
jgi:two-component system sensor histidine kinase YesM